jgi:GPH family glycoside/pentoside/hexuronide:cation symporter
MCVYALGEGANSLVMNGVFAFAMIYYTKALGLDPFWAGIAMSASMFWEAVSEPLMGHFSDNTRSRWGRRHPYMLFGGLLMTLCCYLIWAVPETFRVSPTRIFWYLVIINLILRTGLTMFFIPYMALGFDICTDYYGRSRLQAIRVIFNLIVNFAGPAMAWTYFFQDRDGVRGTTVPANYLHMGIVFALATAVFALVAVAGTAPCIEDTRAVPRKNSDHWIRDFFHGLGQIILDPNTRWVTLFIFVTSVGTVWVSSLQIFVYDDFMRFSAHQKTIAHGSTMVGMALGAYFSMGLAKRFDKRGTVLLGGLVGIVSNGVLALCFLTGILEPGTIWSVGGLAVPLALCCFVLFHASYWLGIGIMIPIATAMMADVSEIQFLQTGIKKDGGYSSVFSLAIRLACAIGLIASGYGLHLIGYQVLPGGAVVTQSPSAIWRLGMITFTGGMVMCLVGLLTIRRHSVTHGHLEGMRSGRTADGCD